MGGRRWRARRGRGRPIAAARATATAASSSSSAASPQQQQQQLGLSPDAEEAEAARRAAEEADAALVQAWRRRHDPARIASLRSVSALGMALPAAATSKFGGCHAFNSICNLIISAEHTGRFTFVGTAVDVWLHVQAEQLAEERRRQAAKAAEAAAAKLEEERRRLAADEEERRRLARD